MRTRHRLISSADGWRFEPFAEARIRALEATGLLYASQSYEVEGFTIRVRLTPDAAYIKIDGGTTLNMDSGVVDLGNLGFEAPARFLPGNLYRTQYYSNYTIGFTKPTKDWFTNPAENTSQGQFAGLLSFGKETTGKIRPDGYRAESFSPVKTGTAEDGTPIYEPEDEALYIKKLTAYLCPASMFTGKCRLYVQAMYGVPAYSGKKSNFGHLTANSGGRPSLRVKPYKKSDDETEYPDVTITTDSGVYFHKEDGTHWLINMTKSYGDAYPLKAPADIESHRKTLVAHYKGDQTLTDEDAEHLECYILSRCRPYAQKMQRFTFGGHGETKPVWSLGYGWHWNWSGTRANFVYTETFYQDNNPSSLRPAASRSTHFQCDVTFANGVFEANTSIVDGPTDWTLKPSNWCVLEANWGGKNASKLNYPYTNLFACDAVFYVFYKKDELVSCSVKMSIIPSDEDNFVEQSDHWDGVGMNLGFPGPTMAATLGMLDGHYTDRKPYGDLGTPWAATFKVGSVVAGPLYYNRAYQEQTYSITNKAEVDRPDTIMFDYGYQPFAVTLNVGYPPFEQVYLPHAVPDIGFPPNIHYDFKSHIKTVTFYSYGHVMTPFMDAEAMLVHSACVEYDLYTLSFKQRFSSGGLATQHRPKIFGVQSYNGVWLYTSTGRYIQYNWYGMEQSNQSPTPVDSQTINNIPDESKILNAKNCIVAAGSVIPAKISDRYEYADITSTTVPVNYEVRSGAREGSDTVCIAESIEARQGISGKIDNPAIVGWV